MNGKGDKPRPVNKARYEANYERIFRKPKQGGHNMKDDADDGCAIFVDGWKSWPPETADADYATIETFPEGIIPPVPQIGSLVWVDNKRSVEVRWVRLVYAPGCGEHVYFHAEVRGLLVGVDG